MNKVEMAFPFFYFSIKFFILLSSLFVVVKSNFIPWFVLFVGQSYISNFNPFFWNMSGRPSNLIALKSKNCFSTELPNSDLNCLGILDCITNLVLPCFHLVKLFTAQIHLF